jgi:ClpP class serine protease
MVPQFFHLGQNWHIDKGFAIAALSKYANNLRAMELGATISDLFLEAKRASETVDYVNVKGGKIAIVPLQGVMMLEGGLCSAGVQKVANNLRAASNDPTVLAIVVEANTGGGESLAGQEFSNAVAESTKPVLFYSHFLASAGVMASLQADEVYAAGNQSEVGSIGVMATIDSSFLEWYAKSYTAYYADTSPNKNEELRSLLEGDPSKLIEALNKADERFMGDVKKYRALQGDAATVMETLSGRMFFANEATKRGLIDGIKNKAEVIDRAEKLAAQYSKSGRPKKGKKMANILAGTTLGNILGIKADDEQTDVTVLQTLEIKFTEMEASVTDLTTKLADSDTAKKAAELNAGTLQARVTELEALNVTLSEKVLSVNANAEALTAQVAALETEKKNLSTQLAALTLKSTAEATPPNEVADTTRIESAAKKYFGGSIEVK